MPTPSLPHPQNRAPSPKPPRKTQPRASSTNLPPAASNTSSREIQKMLAELASASQPAAAPPHPDPICAAWQNTSVGTIVLAAIQAGVCFLEFYDAQRTGRELRTLGKLLKRPIAQKNSPHLAEALRQLEAYFAGRREPFSVRLVFHGTAFQKTVWEQLCRIPYGETWSYAQLAKNIGRPRAVRAVGQANGANRIALFAPCHRVINTGGKLGGYAGGLPRKEALLALESTSPGPLFSAPHPRS